MSNTKHRIRTRVGIQTRLPLLPSTSHLHREPSPCSAFFMWDSSATFSVALQALWWPCLLLAPWLPINDLSVTLPVTWCLVGISPEMVSETRMAVQVVCQLGSWGIYLIFLFWWGTAINSPIPPDCCTHGQNSFWHQRILRHRDAGTNGWQGWHELWVEHQQLCLTWGASAKCMGFLVTAPTLVLTFPWPLVCLTYLLQCSGLTAS